MQKEGRGRNNNKDAEEPIMSYKTNYFPKKTYNTPNCVYKYTSMVLKNFSHLG